MKILHVLNSLGFGGTEIWLLEITKHNANRYQFDFLLTSGEESALDAEFKKHGCNLHYIKYSRSTILPFIIGINRLISENHYSVIHNHEDFVSGWHWLFLLPNLPEIRISHAHNSTIYIDNYSIGFRRKISYMVGRWLVGLFATKITGTSNDLMNQLGYNNSFYRRKRIEPLYCGINTAAFTFDNQNRIKVRHEFNIQNNEKVILFVGRIDCPRPNDLNHKNPGFAFEIAKKVAFENKDIKFLFVGEKGVVANREEQKIRELGLENQIVLLGKRSDINSIMMAADIFILTSILEPFGLVLIEAQLSGMKVISSDIITKELIEFDDQFKLLSLDKIEDWILNLNNEKWDSDMRINFIIRNTSKITNSNFSIESSYQRLLKHYIQSV